MIKQNSILHRRRSSRSNPTFGVSVRKAGRRNLASQVTRPPSTQVGTPGDPSSEEPPPQLINGQNPGSLYEWRLALAFWAAGMTFDYQVSVLGGRSVRGGQVIDFVVHTLPLATPVLADGEHWHDSEIAKEDRLKRIILESEFINQFNPPVVFYGPDLHTVQSARDAVRRVFRR